MTRLVVVLAFAFAFCLSCRADDLYGEIHGNGIYTASDESKANRRLQAYKDEFAESGLLGLANRTDQALDAVLKVSITNLNRKGFRSLAREVDQGRMKFRGEVTRLTMNPSRDIGDFEPLSDWLAGIYDKIEAALGYEICRALRISDIKTFNYTIPIVFRPCSVDMDEYELHFVHDAKYRGLFPVVVYWVSSMTCNMATFGAGAFFICSPISMLIEMGADRWVGPWLSPRIWGAFCD